MRLKKGVIVLGLAGAVTIGSLAVYASSGNISDIESKWLDFKTAVTEKMVEDGKMTQGQADKLLADLEQRVSESDEDVIYERFCKAEDNTFERGSKRMGDMSLASTYAEMAGITPKELMQKCKDEGKSIGVLAEEAGKLDELKKKLIDVAETGITALADDGRITQDKADEMINAAKERINNASADELGGAQIGLGLGKGMPGRDGGFRPGFGKGEKEF